MSAGDCQEAWFSGRRRPLPADCKLGASSGVAIRCYEIIGKKVMTNHAVAPGKLDDKTIAAIVDSAVKLTKEGE